MSFVQSQIGDMPTIGSGPDTLSITLLNDSTGSNSTSSSSSGGGAPSNMSQSQNSANNNIFLNNNNFYNIDDCYKKPGAISDISFEINLRSNYYKSTVKSVDECEIQALRKNSEFFLINDLSNIGNNISINCYIPKINNTNQTLYDTNNSIITKALNLFNGLFKTNNINNPYTKQDINLTTIDTCYNLMFNPSESEDDRECFKYTIDNQVYAPKKYYAYYKKPILDTANIQLIRELQDRNPQYYERKLPDLDNYIDLLKIDTTTLQNNDALSSQNNGSLVKSFKNYICGPPRNRNNELALDRDISALRYEYTKMFNSLNAIRSDLSSINHLNSFDDNTLRALNLNISNKSKELKNLFTSGGANNGRLDDTTLLTQFKIVENSILLIIIICAIFYFTKNKKVI
jgi:hypothetical protein